MSATTETLFRPFPGPYLCNYLVEGIFLQPQVAPFGDWFECLDWALTAKPGTGALPAPPVVIITSTTDDHASALVYGDSLYLPAPESTVEHQPPYVVGLFPRQQIGIGSYLSVLHVAFGGFVDGYEDHRRRNKIEPIKLPADIAAGLQRASTDWVIAYRHGALGGVEDPTKVGEHRDLREAVRSVQFGLNASWGTSSSPDSWLRVLGIWGKTSRTQKAAPSLTEPPLVVMAHGETYYFDQVLVEEEG